MPKVLKKNKLDQKRANKVFDLRQEGLSYAEIATAVGMKNKQQAAATYDRELIRRLTAAGGNK